MANNKITDESNDKKYFLQTPQIVLALCRNPYDYTLWNVIKMIAGEHGQCTLSTPDLGKLAMMSTGKAHDSRAYLLEVGLLEGSLYRDPDYPQAVWHLRVPDIWLENITWRQLYDSLGDRLELRAKLKSLFDEAAITRRFKAESFRSMNSLQDVHVKNLINLKPSPPESSEKELSQNERELSQNEKGVPQNERKKNQQKPQKEEPSCISPNGDSGEAPQNDSEKWNNANKKIVGDKFLELTRLPIPKNDRTKGAWWGWLFEIFEMAGKDSAETCRIMKIVTEDMQKRHLTISSPKSLHWGARALASGQELNGATHDNANARPKYDGPSSGNRPQPPTGKASVENPITTRLRAISRTGGDSSGPEMPSLPRIPDPNRPA